MSSGPSCTTVVPEPVRWSVVGHLEDAIEGIDWHPDGRRLAAVDLAGHVVVLDVEDLSGPRACSGPTQPGGGTSLAWSPAGDQLAVGGAAGTLSIVGAHGGDTRFLDGPVAAVAWSPGGDLLAVAAGWSVTVVAASGDVVAEIGPLSGAVHDLVWAHGPAALAAGTRDAIVWLAAGLASEPVETWDVTGAARTLAVDPTHTRLASGDLGGVLRVADLAERSELAVSGFDQRIERMVWNPAGTDLAVPDDGGITVWALDGIELVHDDPVHLDGHDGAVVDLAYAADSPDRLASVDDDGRLVLWANCPSGEFEAVELGSPGRCVRWRPGQPAVAVGCRDGAIRLVTETLGADQPAA